MLSRILCHFLTEYDMKKIFGIFITCLVLFSCSKDEDEVTSNPFDDPSLKPPVDTTIPPNLDSASFQFLYYHIFKATCSNSGCHDGNFQPDFRTIYSSYNTLVNHPVLLNDVQNSYTYRVEPNNSEKSLIYARLTINIPNTTGLMPAAVDADSDWNDYKDIYIELIKNWIDAGAPDTYGNLPGPVNLNPQVIGIMAFNSGSTTNPLPREGAGATPIMIPPGSPVDIWLALTDDQTNVNDFKLTNLKASYDLFDFTNAIEFKLNAGNSLSGMDFWGNTVSYTHKATISFPSDTTGTFIFLRAYLRDDIQNDTTEIPNNGTAAIMRANFSLKVDSL